MMDAALDKLGLLPKRFVLLVGDGGVVLAQINGRKVQDLVALRGNDEGTMSFLGDLIRSEPDMSIMVLLDVLGQSYRRDTIPKVNFLDRSRLVNRRLNVLFPGHQMRGALYVRDVDEEERAAQQFLFASVTPSPEVDMWLDFLRELPNPLTGICLLPIEATGLVERLAKEVCGDNSGGWTLLFTQHQCGGYRQVVVRNGELMLTRMTPGVLDIQTPSEIASTIEQELGSTIGYLTRLGFKGDDGLDVIIVGGKPVREALDDQGSRLPVRRLEILSPMEAGRIAGLENAVDASGHFADLLHAAWAGSHTRPRLQLMPGEMRRRRQIDLANMAVGAALAASGTVFAVYAGLLGWQAYQYQGQLDSLEIQAEEARASYRGELQREGGDTVKTQYAVAILEVHRVLGVQAADPVPLLARISNILNDQSRLRVLDMKIENPVDPQGVWTMRPGDFDPGDPPDVPPTDARLRLTVNLEGYGDPLSAVRAAEAVARRLAEGLPEMRVRIVRQPISILPDETFSGTLGGTGGRNRFNHDAIIQVSGRIE